MGHSVDLDRMPAGRANAHSTARCRSRPGLRCDISHVRAPRIVPCSLADWYRVAVTEKLAFANDLALRVRGDRGGERSGRARRDRTETRIGAAGVPADSR